MEGGASRGSQIEEKELKVTLLGTWESNGTPLTVNFPSHKSKTFSSDLNPKVEFTGLFGGAMEKWATRRNKNKKKMIQNYIDDKDKKLALLWNVKKTISYNYERTEYKYGIFNDVCGRF